jgi:hypothetical protein
MALGENSCSLLTATVPLGYNAKTFHTCLPCIPIRHPILPITKKTSEFSVLFSIVSYLAHHHHLAYRKTRAANFQLCLLDDVA